MPLDTVWSTSVQRWISHPIFRTCSSNSIKRDSKHLVINGNPNRERKIRARCNLAYSKRTVIQCYAPTNEAEEEDRGTWYAREQLPVSTVPEHMFMNTEHVNAKDGADNTNCDRANGKHGYGEINDKANWSPSRMGVSNNLPHHLAKQDLDRNTVCQSAVMEIKRRRLRWLGHVLKMNQGRRLPKIALSWTPPDKRKPGRPNTTWRRTVMIEVSEVKLAWGEIQHAAQNRANWKEIVVTLRPTGEKLEED
ncbi:hypothetical protein ACROYT_G010354 [Oculina patagonica]